MQIRIKIGNILMLMGIMLMIHWLFISISGEVLETWKSMVIQLLVMIIIPPIQTIKPVDKGDTDGPKPPNVN